MHLSRRILADIAGCCARLIYASLIAETEYEAAKTRLLAHEAYEAYMAWVRGEDRDV